jgi:cell division protein FtsB
LARRIVPLEPANYRYQRVLYRGKSLGNDPRLRWGAGLAVLLLFSLSLVFGEGGVIRGFRLQGDLQELRSHNTRLEQELVRLNQEIEVREGDPGSYEKPAREKWRMVKENERLFLFEDDLYVPAGRWDAEFNAEPRKTNTLGGR